jgi:hypothetical protein
MLPHITKILSMLSPDIVEKVLYVRYNGRICGMYPHDDMKDHAVEAEVQEVEETLQFLDLEDTEEVDLM